MAVAHRGAADHHVGERNVVNAINIAFSVLAGTINAVSFMVHRLMQNWDQLSSAFRTLRHSFATTGHNIAVDFDNMRHAVADWAHNTAAHFDEVRHTVATWAHDVAHYFDDARHTIASWGHDVANTFDQVRHYIATKFDQMRHDVAHWIDDVVNFFKQLPGKIVNALSQLASDLFNTGVHAVQGLINGLLSQRGSLVSAVISLGQSIVGGIASHLHLHSPSKVMYWHGQMIGQGLIDGMDAMQGPLSAAAARMAHSATPGSYGARSRQRLRRRGRPDGGHATVGGQ